MEIPLTTAERLEHSAWWPTKRTTQLQDYAGARVCASCHREIAATQHGTPMANAGMSGEASTILRAHPKITRDDGVYKYAVTRDANGATFSVSDGVNTISAPIAWAFGFGQKGQTYILKYGDLFYESRLSFYTSTRTLELTTGHNAEHPDALENALGLPLDAESVQKCFGCHTTAATTNSGFDPSHLMPGVSCEACHGPGATHSFLMKTEQREQADGTIFNPRKLSPVAQVDFCGACHRTTDDALEANVRGLIGVRFQPYVLEMSKCWGDGDARLACTACHDPHKELVRDAASYDVKCLACHVKPGQRLDAQHRGKACPVGMKECVTCHMPKVTLPSMHAKFADHDIRVVKSAERYAD